MAAVVKATNDSSTLTNTPQKVNNDLQVKEEDKKAEAIAPSVVVEDDPESSVSPKGEYNNNSSSSESQLCELPLVDMNKRKTVDPSKMGNHDSHQFEDSELTIKQQKSQSRSQSRKKHNRRTAKEINRQYICPYKNCSKYYGSEGSLNLHIKIKHNGGNKTDRERLAKTIILAHMKGHLCQVIDQIDLNLPPGTISRAAKKFGLTGQVEH